MFIVSPIILLIFLPKLLKVLHLKHSKTYILTTRRVLIKEGIFSINLTSAPLDKITHITLKQGFFSKIIFNIGDIVIHTAGPTPVEIHLHKVAYPMEVKNRIEELIITERSIEVKTPINNDVIDGEIIGCDSWGKRKL